MALPICPGCAKTSYLCAGCESKLSSGAINLYDVEVSRVLCGLLGDEADFAHAIDTQEQVIIVAKDVGKVRDPSVRVTMLLAGREVRLRVEDNAGGPPEGFEKRLFEPYEADFSTLARAHGVAVSERVTRAAAATGRDYEPWWTTAMNKVRRRAFLDKAWPRKPPAP